MNDDRMKYGTEFTSVKVHQSPGGNSSISLAWEEPARRRGAPPAQHPPKGQSWDSQPATNDRAPPRNPARAYPEPRPAPAYQEPRAPYPDQRGYPTQAYRAYQDPEPAFRDDLPWREEPRQAEAEDPRRRYEQQRGFDQRDMQRGYEQRADPRGYEQRQEPRGYEQRDARFRGEDERQPPPRGGRPERSDIRQLQGYGRPEPQQDFVPRYEQRPQQDPSNVHTSVKVKEPPGGRSNFTFG